MIKYLKELKTSNNTKRVSEKITMINDCIPRNSLSNSPWEIFFSFGSLLKNITFEQNVWVRHKNAIRSGDVFKVTSLDFIEDWHKEQPYAGGFCISYKIILKTLSPHISQCSLSERPWACPSENLTSREMLFFPLEQACILTLSINSSFALGARTLRTLDNVKSCNNKFSWVDLPHKFYLNLCMYAKLYKVVHHKVS